MLTFLRTDPQAFTQDLWLSGAEGENGRRLLGDPDFQALAGPRFSPDGRRIAFVGVGGPTQPPVRRDARRGSPLAWLAPRVAAAHGIPWNLWVVNVDGSELRRLTNELEVDLPTTAWSPDGKWIAFSTDHGVAVVDSVTGSPLIHLVNGPATGGLAWLAK
jgi:Tol biopolymer transport system component